MIVRVPGEPLGLALSAQNDVLHVFAGSAAAASGLQPKDVVRQVEGAPLKEPLAQLLGRAEYGYEACPELVLAVSRGAPEAVHL